MHDHKTTTNKASLTRWATLAALAALALTFALLGAMTLTACSSSDQSSSSKSAGSSDQASADPIEIATKPMTEQYILGEMLKALVEDAGYQANITKGIGGGTNNIHPAMERGDFDVYPEYTSSGWVLVLGHKAGEVTDDEALKKLQAEYQDKYGMTWLGLYGFNNTYTVVVREEIAKQYNLKNTSDLAAVSSELVFGGNPDYIEREDGFPALTSTYGLNFKQVMDIDIGLKYQALHSGDIDVTNGYTTDAQLAAGGVVALADDKQLQVNYFCSTVVREDALASHPGLEDALMKMNGIITDQEMAQLNHSVEVEGKDEAQVARDFLIEKGVLKAS